MRVESYDELRSGMLVVVKPCKKCGTPHRAMLTTSYVGPGHGPGGRIEAVRAFNYLPKHPCDDARWWVLGEPTIARKALYRVEIPGLEASESSTTRRPLHTRKPVGERAR